MFQVPPPYQRPSFDYPFHFHLRLKRYSNAGYLVRCDYTYINDPISAWDYTEVIKQYSHVKYSPFNSNGTGNLGYLYELDQRLAAFFLRCGAHVKIFLPNDEKSA